MITQKQRKKYYKSNTLQYATLTRDYDPPGLDYVLPAGTLVQIAIFLTAPADLYVYNIRVDADFPYDAAELLEDK